MPAIRVSVNMPAPNYNLCSMFYKDYIDQILLDYEQKKGSGTLPLNLSAPTPARLRDECLIICEELQRKDEKILRDFFEQLVNSSTYEHVIKNCVISRFKPLINFLNKPTITTDEKNIELLAWLIRFEPRPFERWVQAGGHRPDKRAIIATLPEESGNDEPGKPEETPIVPPEDTGGGDVQESGAATIEVPVAERDKPGILLTILQAPAKLKLHSKVITIPLAAAVLASASLPVYNYIKAGFSNAGACMYWTGDQYRSVPCDQKIYGSLVIPLDTEKLFHFKKITRPDTITENGINRISYIRLNGNIEYYTRKGDHPVYTERTLNPLTEHMYQKHILPLKQ